MSHAKRLSKASTVLFVLGFAASKASFLPLVMISTILNILSLGMYACGYLLWYISSHLNPDQANKRPEWYGFAQVKDQARIAAIVGLLATAFSAAALFVPVILIPAAWLFMLSNVFLVISEYHKYKNPPSDDPEYSEDKQFATLIYALTVTAITLLIAIATTLIFLFPVIMVPTLIFSAVVGITLGVIALHCWQMVTFESPQSAPTTSSHQHMIASLGSSNRLSVTLEHESTQQQALFVKDFVAQETDLSLQAMLTPLN